MILVADSPMSNCLEYEKINFESQEDAIQTCVRHLMKKKYKLWPDDVIVSQENVTGLKFAPSYSKGSFRVHDDCKKKKFPLQACDSGYTSLRLVDLGFVPLCTQIILFPPLDSYTEIIQDFRFTLTQLLVYIGSNIGSWMSIAMIDLFYLLGLLEIF